MIRFSSPTRRNTAGLICWLPLPSMNPWAPIGLTMIFTLAFSSSRARRSFSDASFKMSLAVLNYIHTEKCLFQAQSLCNLGGGGPGSQDIGGSIPHELGCKQGDLILEFLFVS